LSGSEATLERAIDEEAEGGGYGRGARILSVGIATTGLFTFAYFSVASHVLGEVAAKRIDLLWSVMFVVISVIYRPIEQLLSRTIAERRALGHEAHPLRTPLLIQGAFAVAFLVVALALRGPLENNVFDGSATLYWVLVVGILFYAASYFARGWLAGHQWFGLYGGLVLMESVSRFLFPVLVAVGVAEGQSFVALGIAAAPFVSLLVVPWALRRRTGGGTPAAAPGSARSSAGFALSVAGIMLAEQALLNAPVLTVDATADDAALAGIVFNVLLIARAPLQLFQSIQTSLLPHLAGLEATEGHAAFARAIRITVLAIAGFAGAVALGLLAIGPFAMTHLFGQDFSYGRVGLALVGVGMGLHLVAGTLNQSALARGQAALSGAAWLTTAALFIAWTLVDVIDDQLLRVELGYAVSTGLLSILLFAVYRRGARHHRVSTSSASD
jgi:O-antigen/teichoic acid export membrane protein